MNGAWIKLWFQFFELNADYKAYCEAKRTNDSATCNALESKFIHVAMLYADWGDIHDAKFHEWHNKHKSMFYPAEKPQAELLAVAPKTLDDDAIYVRVPFSLPVSKATKQVGALIRDSYNNASDEQKALKTPPRYKLALKKIDWTTWLAVRKAYVVWQNSQPVNGIKPTNKHVVFKTVEQIATNDGMHLKKYWNWREDEIALRGNLEDLEFQIMRYKRQASQIIANTIHGAFPVKTKPQ